MMFVCYHVIVLHLSYTSAQWLHPFTQEGWFPLSYVREASGATQTMYANDRSLSDTDLSSSKGPEDTTDREWTGVGESRTLTQLFLLSSQ